MQKCRFVPFEEPVSRRRPVGASEHPKDSAMQIRIPCHCGVPFRTPSLEK